MSMKLPCAPPNTLLRKDELSHGRMLLGRIVR